MFDFGNTNIAQRQAIETTKGPLLIIAGPGTGKTQTLVNRALYLITEKNVAPENILIATFTEKAAKELITRITNELAKMDISLNINEMYIGTFHSICLRVIKENIEYTRLKKNFRLMDSFDQQYMVFSNIHRFRKIDLLNETLSSSSAWRQAAAICEITGKLSEELVDVDVMAEDNNPQIVCLAEILHLYHKLLEEENLIDFAAIQTECYRLLSENPDILKKLQDKIQYLMIDEYQDTNYIQEQLVFMLGAQHKNICVVGDDDQGLYRFRGATIRNILEFPDKFDKNECTQIRLNINYRSNPDIVAFYNDWMRTTSGSDFKFAWDQYRFPKEIMPHSQEKINSPAVAKLSTSDNVEGWHRKVLKFITDLKESGKITDYNQVAFLFNSVKHPSVRELADFLEANGISVYSPRSDMYFEREEVQLMIGFLLLLFPKYIIGLEKGDYQYLKAEHFNYYMHCIERAKEILLDQAHEDLKKWIVSHGKVHNDLQGKTTDYAFSGLIYELLAFEPFKSILDADMSSGVVDMRPVRNLALFTQIIGKYEYIKRIDVFSSKYIDKNTEDLFNLYLKLLYDGGITEYEDDSEYAPSGCVSFMTIHQSKGMEFPIVLVDSLYNAPRKQGRDILLEVEKKYYHRPEFEPYDQMKYFDFWRLYYTAFSRAQNLLVLTCNEDKRIPSRYFKDPYNSLIDVSNPRFDLQAFEFQTIKNVDLKNTFSFTSHVLLYENCARQYKFYKELEFKPIREGSMIFGLLVHETIEDIHRAAIRRDFSSISPENITGWFETNYNALVKAEHSYLADPQKKAALKQVLRYAERQDGRWEEIQDAEVDVSYVKPDYIIQGKIDLVKGQDGTVELVDFKSEKKPDIFREKEKIERYRRQLHIYAYLIEKRMGKKVSKMNLYYTGEENGSPIIPFTYTKSAVEGTMDAFDDTVHRIMKKDFRRCSESDKICSNCDFRFYCEKR